MSFPNCNIGKCNLSASKSEFGSKVKMDRLGGTISGELKDVSSFLVKEDANAIVSLNIDRLR